MIKHLLIVGLGGSIGSMARYLCQRWLVNHLSASLSLGYICRSILWLFADRYILGITMKSFDSNEGWKLFLMTGICGGFTTFSAFTLEGIGLLKEQKLALFFGYVAASVLVGLLATYLVFDLADIIHSKKLYLTCKLLLIPGMAYFMDQCSGKGQCRH